MKKLILILLFISGLAKAQNVNLVPNPSFEDTSSCHIGYQFPYTLDWYNPTQCSPDAFHYCNDAFSIFSQDFYKRHTGIGRAGIFVYDSANVNTREYLSVTLKQNLIQQKNYCMDFYVIPTKSLKYGSNKLSVYLGTNLQNYPVGCGIIPQTPQLNLPTGTMLADTANWYHFEGVYNALGNESDIVIGSFSSDSQISIQLINSNPSVQKGSYFVIDDVSLHEMSINSGSDAVTCPGNIIATIGETNTDTAFKSYYWYNAGGALIDSVDAQIQVQPTANTFYVQEKRMCGQSMFDTVFVNVQEECPQPPETHLIIPNVFSPNGDGLNDTWKIDLGKNSLQSFALYNRWGIELINSKDSNKAEVKTIMWDGHTTSGEKSSEGVYYYIMELINPKGDVEQHKGYISLVR